MPSFQGLVNAYSLTIISPQIFTNYKRVIAVYGSFGLGRFYFVPEEAELGLNEKRENENVFEVYVHLSSWPAYVDMLRHEKNITFSYLTDDNTAHLWTEVVDLNN